MKALLFLLFLLTSLSATAAEKIPVWIDYDIGLGKKFHDVDDGLALMHALFSKDVLEIRGISYGFGNTIDLLSMKRITQKILIQAQATEIQFFEGARSPSMLGQPTPASAALIVALEQGPLVIMAMGRMTNVATVLTLRPDLAKNIKNLIINAGRRLEYPTRYGPRQIIFPDTNIDGDLAAMKLITRMGILVTMIPTESMTEMVWTHSDLKTMRRAGGFLGWMADLTRGWISVWKIFIGGEGFIPWDVFIVSYLTHPEDFHCDEQIPFDLVTLKNDTHGVFRHRQPLVKDFLVASHTLETSNRGTYCYQIEPGHRERLINFWLATNF